MSDTTKTKAGNERIRVRRVPARGHYDQETLFNILDDGLVCHVGFNDDEGRPTVIPMAYWRAGGYLYLHGATSSRLMRLLGSGRDACITVTLLDGLILARSAFHHSMNYRSAVVFGKGRPVTDEVEKNRVLYDFMEFIDPGRWDSVRPPSEQELRATAVIAFSLNEASAKIRTGPPKDDAEDLNLPVWAGIIPITRQLGEPIPDEYVKEGTVCGFKGYETRGRQ